MFPIRILFSVTTAGLLTLGASLAATERSGAWRATTTARPTRDKTRNKRITAKKRGHSPRPGEHRRRRQVRGHGQPRRDPAWLLELLSSDRHA